ncbi:MAG: hypothetical protein Q8N37_04900 [bacterium]|nr:hypothetical protein [bacterium]
MVFNITKQKFDGGFSLLELLIYIAILSGFLVVIVNLFFTISTSSTREEVRVEVRQNLRFASQKIVDEVRSGKEIISATLADGGSGNILDIKIADETTTRFSVSSGVLRRTQNFGLPGEITENITTDQVTVSMSPEIFSRAGSTIQINLKIDYNDNGRGDYKFFESVKTTASLRL